MNLIESFNISINSLRANKLKTFLTLLGIIIGVMAIILLVSVIVGTKAKIKNEIIALGANVLAVYPGNYEASSGPPGIFVVNKLRLRHLDLIEARSSYGAETCPEFDLMGVIVKYKRESRNVAFVAGVDANFEYVYTWKASSGSFFKQEDVKAARRVAVVGETVVKDLFQGSNPIGRDIIIRGLKFKVIGVMESKGMFFGMDADDSVYMPITTAHNLAGSTDIHQITIRIKDAKDIDKAAFEIKRILGMKLNETDFSVGTQGEMLDMFNDFMMVLEIVTYCIAGISLLVGGIGIMNIMLVTVTERIREIGIRKAVGASFYDILIQFMVEAVFVAVTGGILGIIFSLLVISVLVPYVPFPLKASGYSILLAFTFSGLVGIFFGTYPAVKAAKTDPIVALRYE